MEYLQRWKILGSTASPAFYEKESYSQLPGSPSDTESLLDNSSENSEIIFRTSTKQNWTYRAVTTLIFALFNIAFLVVIWFSPLRNDKPWDPSDSIFPRPQYETVIFHDDHILPSPEANKVWTDQLPHGNGFTIVPEPERYNLPKGQAYGDAFNKYGVSWAHQYHCIWMLKDAFWDLVNNKSSLVGVDAMEKSKEGGELWHLAHCFGYLRQHVLCNMDMTLEWPTLGGPNAGIINGYEIPHQCKKREHLDSFMDQHAPDPSLLKSQHLPHLPSHQDIIDGADHHKHTTQ